jgi:heptosyltransferase II
MKILIELPTWLGDAVMTSPAIENIVNHFGEIEITLIGSVSSIESLQNHPKVFKSIIVEKNFNAFYKFSKELGRFETFFSFRESYRSTVLKFFILSDKKFQFKRSLYRNLHQVEKYNSFVNDSLNINLSPGPLNIYPGIISNDIDIYPKIGINPGASYGDSKQWYPEEFAKVAIKLSKKYNILIFGGVNEIKIANEIENILIKNGILNYQNIAGKTSISELVQYISKLDLFITGDSGPMHIAASFQIPTIALFGPTKDNETSQWLNEKGVIIKKSLECQPCMKRKCPLKHHHCMKLITAEDVIQASKSLNVN